MSICKIAENGSDSVFLSDRAGRAAEHHINGWTH